MHQELLGKSMGNVVMFQGMLFAFSAVLLMQNLKTFWKFITFQNWKQTGFKLYIYNI